MTDPTTSAPSWATRTEADGRAIRVRRLRGDKRSPEKDSASMRSSAGRSARLALRTVTDLADCDPEAEGRLMVWKLMEHVPGKVQAGQCRSVAIRSNQLGIAEPNTIFRLWKIAVCDRVGYARVLGRRIGPRD
ncbi:hypothetical protein [Amorphus orientalis]|uniref:hypothetical protein n=1 Tax=Amorphus orientalis TaxID=649198 RepID=UPI0027D8E9D6|nr:hypothetical protein [Amorphus orientalis]